MSISSALLKVAGVSVLGGGIILGAMVTFNGGDTIDTAKEKITEFAERINLYESNETELVNRIVSLKEERDNL